MKKLMFAGLLSAAFSMGGFAFAQDEAESSAAAQTEDKAAAAGLDTFEKRLSYAIGIQMASEMKQNFELQLDPSIVSKAMTDVYSENDQVPSEEDLMAVMAEFQERMMAQRQKMQEKMQAEQAAAGSDNLGAAEKFLEENGKKEDVVTTASGLQYKVLKMGEGEKPAATDKVKVHYRGTLLDGTEFDSSYKRGTPAEFPLNQVIKGWTEGLQLMPVGSKFEFYIHPDMAYGAAGRPSIPPNSMLKFEVELLEIL